MRIRFSARANREFQQAADYLLQHDSAAARAFADVLEAALEAVRRHPDIGRPTSNPPTRVLTLTRFPYRIFYEVIAGDIAVLSIFHTGRKPDELSE